MPGRSAPPGPPSAGEEPASPRPTPPAPGERLTRAARQRNVGISAEARKKLLAKPFVRKALDVSGGSLIEVVRRESLSPPAGEPNGEDLSGEVDTE